MHPTKNRVVSCKIVPTKIVGLSKVEQVQEKPRDKRLLRRAANSDLLDAEEEMVSPVKMNYDGSTPQPNQLGKNASEQAVMALKS